MGFLNHGTQGEEVAMWSVILRTIPPAVLLAGGIGSVIFGAKSHSVTVHQMQEREIEIPVPFGPPGFPGLPFEGPGGEPPFEGPPGTMPFENAGPMMAPPPFMSTMKQKIVEPVDPPAVEPEFVLVQEVTVGGVELRPPGELWRTYMGKRPSLCPT
jgi:hypothetical protein